MYVQLGLVVRPPQRLGLGIDASCLGIEVRAESTKGYKIQPYHMAPRG